MTETDIRLIEALKEKYLDSDNLCCFYEREEILERFSKAYLIRRPGYADIISAMLKELSPLLFDEDVFAGRMVEAHPDPSWSAVPHTNVIDNPGHIHLRYDDILTLGVRAIVENIEKRASMLGDVQSKVFAVNSRKIYEGIESFARRYSEAARKRADASEGEAKERFGRIARALSIVPMEPAYDLFSALQSVWFIHFIASCCVGARDYGFGRPDQYLNRFYEKDLANGKTQDELDAMIAFFLVMPNFMCGIGMYNPPMKPIPSRASKQYMTLGGLDENGKPMSNAASYAILRAEEISNMPEPVIVNRVNEEADPDFAAQVYGTISKVTDKMHIYNDRLVFNTLVKKGVPPEIAADHTFSGCCCVDLNWRLIRNEWYLPMPQWLNNVLGVNGGEVPDIRSAEELISLFKAEARRTLENDLLLTVGNSTIWRVMDRLGHTFDGMFMGNCAETCRYPLEGGVKRHLVNVYLCGAATVIDSITAVDKLVFREKRYTLEQFVNILKNNFEGEPLLWAEIKNRFPKFGNDDEDGDRYANAAMSAVLDAIDEMQWPEDYIPIGSFYSLNHHNNFGWAMEATPDGRKRGEAFSENQSPVYGADKKGVTALLKSVAKLPLTRTASGGINLTFSNPVTPEMIGAITKGYFDIDGIHTALTVVDRATLEAALENPQAYRTLTVRLFGFSEYFINVAKWQQKEIIERTKL
ncbi:MAG: hypothetical protein IJG50_00050 [Clostridia bacterium]|nr:hypothetical protein [Clostridia bacterium]